MTKAIIPKPLEDHLQNMERGPIGMVEEARRLRHHLLTCPNCIREMTKEMTNKSKNPPKRAKIDK
jgi:hypothetical protein